MNYLKWNDFNPDDYPDLYEAFRSTFIKLLPNTTLQYH